MEISLEDLTAAFAGAIKPLADQIGELSCTVAALQEGRETPRDQPPAEPLAKLEAVGLAPLVDAKQLDDEGATVTRRYLSGSRLGLSAAALDTYVAFGGRGLYRQHREEIKGRPRPVLQEIILDAQKESPREAAQMGADLLKCWDDTSPPPIDA